MKTTKIVYKIFFSFEKEEKWLEEMSSQGWHLVNPPGVGYRFEQGLPEDRIYKIDYRTLKNQDAVDEYVSLFEDSDWVCINPYPKKNNYYFYTQSENEMKHIFSDKVSKAQRYHRFANMLTYSIVVPILPLFALYVSGAIKFSEIGYLTPGLWEMQGFEFVRHFLFETPFVLMRLSCGLYPFLILLLVLIFRIKAERDYKKTLQQEEGE